jgi:hypothetical protein
LYGTEWQLSTEGSGGNEGGTQFIGIAEYSDYLYPTIQFKRSNGQEYSKLVNLTKRKDVKVNYDNVFTYTIDSPGIPTTVSQLVTPSNDYNLLAPVDTTITSYISSADKIKSLTITQGLDFMHYLPTLPNVKHLNINGRTSNYSVNSIDISVKDSLPIVETLNITNTTFSNSILDFRNCNRLSSINLQGCIGIQNIIFPETNRLSTVYLPNDLKQLSIGINPNLSTFVIPEGTKLTSISLNCSNFNSNFDYINILNNYVDYGNLTSFVFNNTPEDGLFITEDIANKLAEIQLDVDIQKSIKGKFIIKERNINTDENGIITYTWGDKSDISYLTKKKLVQAFKKIDSISNDVYFDFIESDLNEDRIAPEIAIDVPTGGITVYPFDGLYFQEGNDVKINTDGTLAIEYNIIGTLPSGSNLDKKTGKLTVTENTNKSYTFTINVTKNDGTKYDPISGSIYLGYKAPKVGDFAYSDGTFSTASNPNKTLIGMVYQVEETVVGSEWKLCILGTESVSGCFGADMYRYSISAKDWSDYGNSQEQEAIYTFMTNSSGLALEMNQPAESVYLGISPESYDYASNGIDRSYQVPQTIVESGLNYTTTFASIGLNRLTTYISNNTSFKSTLINKKYYNNNKLQNLDSMNNIDEVCSLFNESIVKNFPAGVDYSKVLNPIYIKTLTYEPKNLEGEFAKTNYSKGNWYIPSIKELELLIYYRIMSTTKATDTNIKGYWNSTDYDNGNSIFSATSSDFKAFLNSDMVAAQASIDNKNYAYGGVSKGYPPVTIYGWHHTYPNVDYAYEYLDTCRRDITRTITPCCQVTVTKS